MNGSGPRPPGATDGPGPLSALEQAVLAAMFRDDMLAPLRTQLARATVVSRTHSGVGFVTRLAVPDDTPALTGSAPLPPLTGRHPALQEPAEFLLQLRDGRLATLEAFCAVGSWPADESGFRLPG
jgi:hypothetical protein